jgi:D-glycero-alpha-D-manno-heptose 1-phosphate guanylyltransferase
MECIILAGGLGTRLRSTIGDQPKAMAPVNGLPFLHYVFRYLESQGCSRAILSLGYQHEPVLEWLSNRKLSFEIVLSIEKEPLGTGGGIRLAMKQAISDTVAVLNGDTLFLADINKFEAFHTRHGSECSLALKPMQQFERYGCVKTDDHDRIISFEEKTYREQGLINGGIYLIDKAPFMKRDLPEKFSFEKDYLEVFTAEGRFYGMKDEAYFIDIGVPADYDQAQQDLKTVLL